MKFVEAQLLVDEEPDDAEMSTFHIDFPKCIN
jgi:hypothetical protein